MCMLITDDHHFDLMGMVNFGFNYEQSRLTKVARPYRKQINQMVARAQTSYTHRKKIKLKPSTAKNTRKKQQTCKRGTART